MTSSSATPPSEQLNLTPTAAESSENVPPMDGSPACACTRETFGCSIHPSTRDEWIACMQVFLARILASPENRRALARKQEAVFIAKSCDALASFDRATCSPENVAAILAGGGTTVVADLAALGYDAEWLCLRASDCGAPHRRDRWWCLGIQGRSSDKAESFCANSDGIGPHRTSIDQQGKIESTNEQICIARQMGAILADTKSQRRGEARKLRRDQPEERIAGGGEAVADATRPPKKKKGKI